MRLSILDFRFWIAGLMAVASGVATLPAASVSLAWDRNVEQDVTSYRIYWGRTSGNYTNVVNVGNVTSYTVTGLATATTYYFAATAVTATGLESPFSAEISNITPVTPPANFRVLTNSLQSSFSTEGPWQNVAVWTVPVQLSTNIMASFYRNKLDWER